MAEMNLDLALVAQVKAGDPAAFEELIRRNSPVAIRAIRAITSNPADTEDIMQDTLLKVYKGLAYFRGDSKFSTWLVRIAINCALAFHRKRKETFQLGLEAGGESGISRASQLTDQRLNQEQTCIRNELVKRVRRAIRQLPSPMRQYTSLRYLDELPHDQVASKMGISLAAGKSRSNRARKMLERSLTGAL